MQPETQPRAPRNPARPSEPRMPTGEELLQGRYENGARLQYLSRMFYKGAWKLYTRKPADFPFENQDPLELSKEALLYEAKRQRLQLVDKAISALHEAMNYGLDAMRNGQHTDDTHNPAGNGRESGVDKDDHENGDSNDLTDTGSPVRQDGDIPDDTDTTAGGQGARPTVRAPYEIREIGEPSLKPPQQRRKDARREQSERQKIDTVQALVDSAHAGNQMCASVGSSRPEKPLSAGQGASIVMKAAPLLAKLAAERELIHREMIEIGCKADTKEAFMQDRAVAVVHATALHLDEEFQELGFGAWMPFRWPDQWLSFCGVLRRVLAANGLIHSEHADVYRRLLDETPPVEFDPDPEKRIRQSRIPRNLARSYRLQSAETLEDLSNWIQFRGPPPGFGEPP